MAIETSLFVMKFLRRMGCLSQMSDMTVSLQSVSMGRNLLMIKERYHLNCD